MLRAHPLSPLPSNLVLLPSGGRLKPSGTYDTSHAVHLRLRGRTYYVDYIHEGLRIKESLKTDNKKAAELLRAEIEHKLLSGVLKQPVDIRLDDFLKEYEAHIKATLKPKNWATQIGYLRRFAAGRESARLTQLSSQLFEKFLAAINGGAPSPKTFNNVRGYFYTLFEYAKRHQHVLDNPIDGIDRRREPQRTIRFIKTHQEIRALLALFADDILEPVIATYIYAGLRRTEACWLTREDVDLKRRLLHIREKTIEGESWCPKTKRNRVVPISRKLLPYLKQQMEDGAGEVWLFPSPEGTRWDSDNLGHRYTKAVRKAKLPWTLLDLRHTFGSHLAMKGVSLYKIATFMGNSPQICQRHYATLIPEELGADVEF